MKKVSAIIITNNNSRVIASVLRSVSWCDELVVVDSGSCDDTVSKAESMGARIVVDQSESLGALKALAVLQARNNWVLSVDGDEEISSSLREAIRALPDECRMSGYHITRVEKFAGKILEKSQLCHSSRIRLFDRRHGNFSPSTAKESVELEGRTGTVSGFLIHDRYASLSDYFQNFDTETSRQAQIRFDQGKRTSKRETLFKFPQILVVSLLGKRGILDGYEGILRGLFYALFSVVKHAKLLELQRLSNR